MGWSELAATLVVMALLTVELPAGAYVQNLCVNRDTCNLIFDHLNGCFYGVPASIMHHSPLSIILIMTSLLISKDNKELFAHIGDCGSGDICFSNPNCTGAQITAGSASARDCCVGTDDGLSYGTPRDCEECIGEHKNV